MESFTEESQADGVMVFAVDEVFPAQDPDHRLDIILLNELVSIGQQLRADRPSPG